MIKKTFAFGPMVGLPATEWVGRDVGKFLDGCHGIEVIFFDNFQVLPSADAIFVVMRVIINRFGP
ncbi:hypothetical protein [Thiorhodovibrio winogradskyi]|uniref:hypothetical protein n=1 Tax=Thiorhodovibrio winogradskyi TaxID=77007 RepID=UPI002E27C299|nr:hypothetical protein [Thiorhodovibrio winogradskyi]